MQVNTQTRVSSYFRKVRLTALPCLLGLSVAMVSLPPAAEAVQSVMPLAYALNNNNLEVSLYKSKVVEMDGVAKRISVGNPGVADILILRGRQLYVVGKALGTTNVVVWDSRDDVIASFSVEVTHDLETLKLKLHQLLPGERVDVHSAQERIVLSGEVTNVVKMKAAEELAYSFLAECVQPESNVVIRDSSGDSGPVVLQQGSSGRASGSQECKEGSVVNMLQVGGAQQVMLEVKVAEMARTVLKQLDTDLQLLYFDNDTKLGAISGGATFPNALVDTLDAGGNAVVREIPIFPGAPLGPNVDLFDPNTPTIGDKGLLGSYISNDLFIQAAIEASRQKGLAKILAEPVLTALTGEEATFLSGGEFPIPVPQGDENVTIEFKEFGVGLGFLPVVLDSGRINLKLNVAVSEIRSDNSVTLGVVNTANAFFVPSLSKRSTTTSVELGDGQTIGIAGLINDNLREVVNRLPGLGDLPVLGQLFNSQEFVSGQTELVIFVTPRLARPIAPEDIRLPTDNFVAPNDLEFYLLGRMEGYGSREKKSAETTAVTASPEAQKFGHEL
ncbi:MAG: type II and III secretion system protein family protein [Gammaproteobacteria bacterium]|jgi:pilus assembly protein CpaC